VIPSATYRLQFRNGVTFDSAIALIAHLKTLGITHLYASPIFAAVKGSIHGYDVVDCTKIDPAIGGREGFNRLSAALQDAGMGLILDIVPNHMAASVENAWWRDLLRNGKHSRYARHFDIDWTAKLTLPVLGKSLEETICAHELQLVYDPVDQSLALAYFDTKFPISRESEEDVLAELDGDVTRLSVFSTGLPPLARLLEKQHWRLMHWKEASSNLSYRRFFEVTGLVGMRVEDDQVFADTHRLVVDLVSSGKVRGLRIDHVDGLADPSGYLDTLRAAVGVDTYIIVEKILGPGEQLPVHWPVSGTTGYEFISALCDLYIHNQGVEAIQQAYAETAPERADYRHGLRQAKQQMVEENFAGEVHRLVRFASEMRQDTDPALLRGSIEELLIAFPVYRTYGLQGALSDQDRHVLDRAVEDARLRTGDNDSINFIEEILSGKVGGAPAIEFRMRFQQLSGPIMAKALEDTLFYRFSRLIAANEVGGDPGKAPGGLLAFHSAMSARLAVQAAGLSATSTHDTKRGEDARARLYTLSEAPSRWCDGVSRWRDMNRDAVAFLQDGFAPEPNLEWMLYQALAGVWSVACADGQRTGLRDRFVSHAVKALREAKLRTNWVKPNRDYEKAVTAYAERVLSPTNRAFIDDFDKTIGPFLDAGFVNSLSQTMVKLTAPGIPDIYQGAEGLDLSLVDPDNRRPVEYAHLTKDNRQDLNLDECAAAFQRRKVWLISAVLTFRKRNTDLFNFGGYLPIEASGRRKDNILAFARVLDGQFVITLAPRLIFGHVIHETTQLSPEFWEDTILRIPVIHGGPVRDVLSGRIWNSDVLLLSDALNDHQVGLMTNRATD
jgi:(1->4)-alpha-D-glucan 1-alpha-D-glucosylmutase